MPFSENLYFIALIPQRELRERITMHSNKIFQIGSTAAKH